MTADSPHLELLWRHLDGEPLDASEVATLKAALSTDPVLREMSELHQQTRSLIHGLPLESAPASIIPAIAKGIATPAPVAKVLIFGLPLQRFALVAALLLAVGWAYLMRPKPISHEVALIGEHLAAVQAEATFRPLLSSVSADPDWLDFRGLLLPARSMTRTGQRDCVIVDCPATQFFGTHWNGTPMSIFVVDHEAHFELDGYVLAAGGTPKHEYGVIRMESATLVAWKEHGKYYGMVANMAAGDLIALAEQADTSLGSIPVVLQLASLNRHTIQ